MPLVVEFCTFVQYIVSFLDSSGCDNILEKLFISIKHRRMCVCVCVCVWIIRCIRLGRLVFVVIPSCRYFVRVVDCCVCIILSHDPIMCLVFYLATEKGLVPSRGRVRPSPFMR